MPKPPHPSKSLYKRGAKMAREKKEGFDQIKYQNKYKKENYDRTELVMPKGKKDRIKSYARAAGQSMSEYINQAIDERIAKDVDSI